MKTVYLNKFMSSVVTELEMNGQYGTAHVCGSVLRSVMAFGGEGLPVSGITPLWLKAYEGYLLHKGGKGLAWNTVSTYMRMLQAVYNRAVARKLAAFIPHQFRDVFTGRKADHRRVLERDDMQKLLVEREPDITSPGMAWACVPGIDVPFPWYALCGSCPPEEVRSEGRLSDLAPPEDGYAAIRPCGRPCHAIAGTLPEPGRHFTLPALFSGREPGGYGRLPGLPTDIAPA